MARMNLIAPWVKYYRELDALFKNDDSIVVIYDEEKIEVKIYVNDYEKGIALGKYIPMEKEFGEVVLKINIIFANQKKDKYIRNTDTIKIYEDFDYIFMTNHCISNIKVIKSPLGIFTYIIFKKEVVQYFNDNISDIDGKYSTLYEDIARDIFINTEGVFFCTSK